MKNDSTEGKSAKELFPDLLPSSPVAASKRASAKKRSPSSSPVSKKKRPAARPGTEPPAPPDTSWLPQGLPERSSGSDERPRCALLFITNEQECRFVLEGVRQMGFQADMVRGGEQAIKLLRDPKYSLVVSNITDAKPQLHEYMRWLPPDRRRHVFYTLTGHQLRTLYDLEALSLSANLVVSEEHVKFFAKILKKGLADYEQLYRPLLEELQIGFKMNG